MSNEPKPDQATEVAVQLGRTLAEALKPVHDALHQLNRAFGGKCSGCKHVRMLHGENGCAAEGFRCACPGFVEPEARGEGGPRVE